MRQTLLFLFSFLLLFSACSTSKLMTVQQSAKPATLPEGAPRYSDVCFSSRWERPKNEQDTFETFFAARSFHATYINWVYTTNPDFIKKAKTLGYRLQAALAPNLPDLPFGNETREQGRIINKDRNFATAPWMKSWNHWWGCVNHPVFREIYFANIKAALDAGAYGFQVDAPAMGFLLLRNKWEDLCYCKHCLHIADSLGVSPPEIQETSVTRFHQNMKAQAEAYAGRAVPFSCNNFEGDWELFPFSQFDFGIAELPERRFNPEYLYATVREARQLGKAQVFSFVHERDWLVQKMIAVTYACGGNMLVPWDVWQDGGRERYFGKPSQYASLFAFVRANARWLDGYEDAFYASSQDDVRFSVAKNLPVNFDEYRRQIHAFVRAKPGDGTAPVVVHVIDWHVLMEPFSLRLNERRFFKNGVSSVELLTPVVFDKTQHEAAETSGDYSKMVRSEKLALAREDGLLRLNIPKLEQHWGILIVHPKPR